MVAEGEVEGWKREGAVEERKRDGVEVERGDGIGVKGEDFLPRGWLLRRR